MNTTRFTLTSLIALTGCTRHYMVVGESDTSKPIAVSIMKSYGDGQPVRLFYTELTGNDTEFVWDQHVDDEGAHVEAWFELRDNPGRRTVYAIPPDKKVRLKLDRKDDGVVVEETRIDGKKHAK
ncbi:MAG: hypothetical protein AABZ08_03170 [Planctomycetota bacterium]